MTRPESARSRFASMVSATTRYGLSIVGHLVNNGDRWSTAKEIADGTGVPANYLGKILSRLAREGLVDSLKGWGGGFRIRPDALERPIMDLVVMLEGRAAGGPPSCIFGLPNCDAERPCPLHDQWRQVRETYERMLRNTSIGSLRFPEDRLEATPKPRAKAAPRPAPKAAPQAARKTAPRKAR